MPLTHDQLLDAAVRLLDESGFAALSMRRIAGALGVQPGALYWHVESKQQLLAGVAARILQDVPRAPQPDDSPAQQWDVLVWAWAHALHESLLAHRDGAELTASVIAMRPADLALIDAPVAALAYAGLSPRDAQAAARAMLHFVVGVSVDEQNVRQFAELGATAGTAREAADIFPVGLQLLLDGVRSRLTPGRNAATRGSAVTRG